TQGGSRNIQQELAGFRGTGTQASFLQAFFPTIVTGIDLSLQRAGINVGAGAFAGLSQIGNVPGGFTPAGMDKMISDLKELIQLSGQLSTFGNLSRFLTGSDIEGLTGLFGQLVGIGDPQAFGKGVAELKTQIQPVIDFLNSAIKQTTDLLGR